ncbi:MAG: benzoate/H(+) symporter BenE family transporter [Rhizobiaceae bacterium]|nr:benzoate/H(+) symporter BenE family transporter [Rhizobiaceae bacterium]
MKLSDFSAQSVFIGSLAAFVGFTSSFAVVLQGLRGVGASEAEAASGLMMASIGMGLCGILLSLRAKQPISVAWSTPGAALLAGTAVATGGFQAAVGAFIMCGCLIIMCGIWKPFQRAVSAIPGPLANALLSGILLSLCLAPFKAIAFDPLLGLPILLAWIVGGWVNRFLGVPCALLAFCIVVLFGVEFPDGWQDMLKTSLTPQPLWITPVFSIEALLSIALPLFIVTMASQNVPGIAVLKANNYEPRVAPLLSVTGLFSVLGAPFGAHTVNLAAITAAMLTSEEAGPDPNKRYTSAIVCGIGYLIFGMFAGLTTTFVSLAPAILIEAVAGLALIAAFSASAVGAFSDPETRPAAAVTFLATASGMSIFGISGAFWGLLGGGLMLALMRYRKSGI